MRVFFLGGGLGGAGDKHPTVGDSLAVTHVESVSNFMFVTVWRDMGLLPSLPQRQRARASPPPRSLRGVLMCAAGSRPGTLSHAFKTNRSRGIHTRRLDIFFIPYKSWCAVYLCCRNLNRGSKRWLFIHSCPRRGHLMHRDIPTRA